MSQTDDTTPLSFITHLNATQPGALPMNRPVLLGTFTDQNGIRALIRLGNGDIRHVVQGDRIGQLSVEAVDEDHIDLALMGVIHRMTIPERP